MEPQQKHSFKSALRRTKCRGIDIDNSPGYGGFDHANYSSMSTTTALKLSNQRRDSTADSDSADFSMTTYRPLSNLPTPPPLSRQASGQPTPPLFLEEALDADTFGPAHHLANLIPTSASLCAPSSSFIQYMLTRAALPIEVVALAVCILDSLDRRFARSWRASCPVPQTFPCNTCGFASLENPGFGWPSSHAVEQIDLSSFVGREKIDEGEKYENVSYRHTSLKQHSCSHQLRHASSRLPPTPTTIPISPNVTEGETARQLSSAENTPPTSQNPGNDAVTPQGPSPTPAASLNPSTPGHNEREQKRDLPTIDDVQPEVIVLASLMLAVKLTDDYATVPTSYCATYWARNMWTMAQINATESCILQNLDYCVAPLMHNALLEDAIKDMEIAGHIARAELRSQGVDDDELAKAAQRTP